MHASDFRKWLDGMARLTPGQRRRALVVLSEKAGGEGVDMANGVGVEGGTVSQPAAEKPATSPERPGRSDALKAVGLAGVEIEGCPHCESGEIVAWGRAKALPRYRCKRCGRTFNAVTGTPMARLRKNARWLDHAKAMLEATSLAKAAQRCEVHYTTAFRWRHRFLASPALDKPKTLTGIVEADETFVLESFKGRRSALRRPARKRGGKAKHPGLHFENIPILVARDRLGATFDAVLPQVDGASIKAAMGGVVTPANQLVCDGGRAIIAFAKREKIPVKVLLSPGKPTPEAPELHLNNVNAYHGRFKEWMRRFHGVATKNLPNYLGWRRAIEAWGPNASPENWILGTIGKGPYQYQTL